VNNGFHGSEKKQIWSKTESTLMIKNSKSEEHFSVHRALIPGTTINVVTGGKKLSGQAPFRFTIDAGKYKDEWIPVHFQADKSGTPSKIENSKDCRELSFLLSYEKIPEYQKLEFN